MPLCKYLLSMIILFSSFGFASADSMYKLEVGMNFPSADGSGSGNNWVPPVYIITKGEYVAVTPQIGFDMVLKYGNKNNNAAAAIAVGNKRGKRCFYGGEVCVTVDKIGRSIYRISTTYSGYNDKGGKFIAGYDANVSINGSRCRVTLNGGQRKFWNTSEIHTDARLRNYSCKTSS